MNNDRKLAIRLFAGAAVLLWVLFSIIFLISSIDRSLSFTLGLMGCGLVGILAAASVSAWMSPYMAREARAGASLWKGFGLGLFVTLGSYIISAVVIAVSFAVIDSGGVEVISVNQIPFVMYAIFLGSITILSPGLLFGGISGVLFYRIVRSTN